MKARITQVMVTITTVVMVAVAGGASLRGF
jgi:hypothetical protein